MPPPAIRRPVERAGRHAVLQRAQNRLVGQPRDERVDVAFDRRGVGAVVPRHPVADFARVAPPTSIGHTAAPAPVTL